MADTTIKITGDVSGAINAINSLTRQLQSLDGTVKTLTSGFQSNMTKMENSVQKLSNTAASAKNIFGQLFAVFAGASLFTFIDDMQNLQNKLRVTSSSTEEFAYSMRSVQAIAMATGMDLNAVADIYSKIKFNQDQLGFSNAQVTASTLNFARALQISGASAEGARATMYQFGQMLNTNKVGGDEFRTVLENMGPAVALMARNVGISMKELRDRTEKGVYDAKQFLLDLAASSDELARRVGTMPLTVGQSLNNIKTAFAGLFLQFDQASGFSQGLSNAMQFLANNIRQVVAALMIFAGLMTARWIIQGAVAIRAMAAAMAALKFQTALASGGLTILLGLIATAAGWALSDYLVPQENIDNMEWLNELSKEANAELKNMQSTYNSNGAKLGDIIRDLKEQQSIASLTGAEYTIQNKILEINRQLARTMTADQRRQLETILRATMALEAQRDVKELIASLDAESRANSAINQVEAKLISEHEKLRSKYGSEIADKMSQQLRSAIALSLKTAEIASWKKEEIKLQSEINALGAITTKTQYGWEQNISNIIRLTDEELATRTKIAQIENEIGISLNEQEKQRIRDIEYMKTFISMSNQIRKNMDAVFLSQNPMQAAVGASSQLGQLLPQQKLATEQDNLLKGLKYLNEQKLLSDNQYREASLQAEREYNAAVLAARQKRMEDEMRSQGVVNTEIISMVKDQMAAVAMMQQGGIQGVQGALMAMTNVFDLMKGGNRKAFETYKSLATAQALISTYQAAAMSIAAPPGPPFSYIYVASAILAGMAQVAKIRSMQFSGRAVGGPVVGGQSYLVGEKGPEIFTPGTAGGIVKNSDIMGAGGVNVNFNITATDATSFDQLLVNRRGLITQIISDAMTEKGRRGI